MNRFLLAAMGAIAAVACAAPSSAAIVDIRYTGLASGFDGGGLWGALGASYVNTPFEARYLFEETPDPGDGLGHVIAVSLTLNGVTFDFEVAGGDTNIGADRVYSGYGRATSYLRSGLLPGGNNSLYVSMQNSLVSPLTPGDRTIGYVASGGHEADPLFVQTNHVYVDGNRTGLGHYYSILDFNDQQVQVLSTPSVVTTGPGIGYLTVPEPSIWASLIIGFGAAGAVLRRRGRAEKADLGRDLLSAEA